MEYKQMSLRECAQFDKNTGAREKLTGWARICKARSGPNSKSQRRKNSRRKF